MQELELVRKNLEEKRSELATMIQRIEKSIHKDGTPLDPDFEEQAVELENAEAIDALDVVLRDELEQVNNALIRIENNEYGLCSKCGAPIAPQRLEALPYTDRCMKCAT